MNDYFYSCGGWDTYFAGQSEFFEGENSSKRGACYLALSVIRHMLFNMSVTQNIRGALVSSVHRAPTYLTLLSSAVHVSRLLSYSF